MVSCSEICSVAVEDLVGVMDSNVSVKTVKRPSYADVLKSKPKNNAANVGSQEEVEPTSTTCIEDLPGDVLPIIMSRLKIREVVRASLTCKQWLNLPAYRSNILLDPLSMTDDNRTKLCPAHKDLFITRVNKYLQMLEKLQATVARIPVSMFMIHFCLRQDSSPDIDSWIRYALRNGVRRLHVCLDCSTHQQAFRTKFDNEDDGRYIFPSHLLDEAPILLEQLLLSSCVFGRSLTTVLTSLKILEIHSAHLTEADICNIFAQCPNLTKLALGYCKLPAKLFVGGYSLTSLKVQGCQGLRQIQLLHGPSLSHFKYCGPRVDFIDFDRATELIDVVLFMHHNEDWRKRDEYIPPSLHLDFAVMKSLTLFRLKRNLSWLSSRTVIFPRLETLKMVFGKQSWFNFSSLLKLLSACPLLRDLEMTLPRPQNQNDGTNYGRFHSPIQVFHKSLKVVKMKEFVGGPEQEDLVTSVIQSSTALEKLIIEPLNEDVLEIFLQGRKKKFGSARYKFRRSMKGGTLIFK